MKIGIMVVFVLGLCLSVPVRARDIIEVQYLADPGVRMLPVKLIGDPESTRFAEIQARLTALGMHQQQLGEVAPYLDGCYIEYDPGSFWVGCVDVNSEIRFLTLSAAMKFLTRASQFVIARR